jgi:hypothetical protein
MSWIDTAILGIYRVLDPSGTELPRRATLKFTDGISAKDDTDKTVVTASPHLPHTPCRVASTANVNLGGTLTSVDSVTLADGDRVCLWLQTTAAENGVYTWSSATSTLSRASDWDNADDIATGATVYVKEGTLYGGKVFTLLTTGTITVGTSDQKIRPDFIQVTQAFDAGNIGAGSQSGTAVTVPFCGASDEISVTPTAVMTSGIGFYAHRSSDTQVNLYLYNYTAGSINPPSQNFVVTVRRAGA